MIHLKDNISITQLFMFKSDVWYFGSNKIQPIQFIKSGLHSWASFCLHILLFLILTDPFIKCDQSRFRSSIRDLFYLKCLSQLFKIERFRQHNIVERILIQQKECGLWSHKNLSLNSSCTVCQLCNLRNYLTFLSLPGILICKM